MWQVNPEKTKVIHFRPQSFSLTDFQFKCANHDILKVNSYKYLWIWLDEHLTFDKSTKELASSASRALGAVYGKFMLHALFVGRDKCDVVRVR
jgi:hypothetical protein